MSRSEPATEPIGRRLRPPAWLPGRVLVAFAAVLALLWIAPLVLPIGAYTHNVIGLTFMFMAAALAWNWLGGYVGQISFGHAAMFGVGGFVAARLMLAFGWPFWVTWLVGGLVAGCYALLWGHPTLRLRGPYFSIATIGVGEATRLVATYWSDFTGGSSGLSLPLGGGPTKYQLYWYGLYLVAAAVAVSYWLRKSRIGLALLAIKDQGFIDPQDMFSFDRSISFILMGVIGGIGTILGPIGGAVVFVIIQEFLLANYSQFYLGLYGTLLILIILFEPLGLTGLVLRLRRLVGYRPRADVAAGGLRSAAVDAEPSESTGDRGVPADGAAPAGKGAR